MRAVIQRVQHAGVRIVGCDTVAAYEKKRGDEAKAVEKEKKREIILIYSQKTDLSYIVYKGGYYAR